MNKRSGTAAETKLRRDLGKGTYRQTAQTAFSDLSLYQVYQRGGSEVTVTWANMYTQ